MNRRKLFGILAAAPAAAVAANADNPNTVRIKLPPLVPGQKMVFRNYEATPLEFPKPKCYSVWNYDSLMVGFMDEYRRKKYNLETGTKVFRDACFERDFAYNDNIPGGVKLPGFTSVQELRQAFADACLNGEVPGVWWE